MIRACLAVAVLLLPGCRAHAPTRASGITVRMFDVGYGDAVLVSSGDTNILFDAGPAHAGPALASKLRAAGAQRLDLLVLSHPHPDHFAGLAALRSAGIDILRTVHNPAPDWTALEAVRTLPNVTAMHGATPSFTVGGFKLTPLHPDDQPRPDPNDRSLVILVERNGWSALFTGDVVDTGLQAGLCDRLPAKLDVLKLPHHGDHLAPCLGDRAETLILSIAANPWGVPRPEVLERYGDRIRRTDHEGNLTLND